MKRNILFLIIMILVVSLCAAISSIFSYRTIKRLKTENDRIIRESSLFYKTVDERNAAMSEGIELRLKEFEEFMPKLCSDIEKMRIKLDRVEKASTVSFNSGLSLKSQLRDTVVAARYLTDIMLEDSKKAVANNKAVNLAHKDYGMNNGSDSLRAISVMRESPTADSVAVKVFKYHDDYWNIEGVAMNDTQLLRVNMVDTLIQVVHRGKREKPWLWIFSKRRLEQTVRLSNPNAEIKYSKVINVLKR